MLGAESVRQLKELGWVSLPRVFDDDEVARISDEFVLSCVPFAFNKGLYQYRLGPYSFFARACFVRHRGSCIADS